MPSKTRDAIPSVADLDQREALLATEEVENALANAALRGQESALAAQSQNLVVREEGLVDKRRASEPKKTAKEWATNPEVASFKDAIALMLLARAAGVQAREENLVLRRKALAERKRKIATLESERDRASSSLKEDEEQLTMLTMSQGERGFADTVDMEAIEQGAEGGKAKPRSVRHASTLTMTPDEQVVHNLDRKERTTRKTRTRRPAPPVLDVSGEDL